MEGLGPQTEVGRDTETGRIRSVPQVEHRRVADNRGRHDVARGNTPVPDHPLDEPRDPQPDRRLEQCPPVPDVGRDVDPGHDIRPSLGLRVEGGGGRFHSPAAQVDDGGRQGRRPEIDGEPPAAARV